MSPAQRILQNDAYLTDREESDLSAFSNHVQVGRRVRRRRRELPAMEPAVVWILYPLLCYVGLCYCLLAYLTVKLMLGRPMRILVGPQSLSLTPSPAGPILVPRGASDRRAPEAVRREAA